MWRGFKYIIVFSSVFFSGLRAQNIYTVAGNGTAGYGGDGGPALSASINDQYQLATDRKGNLYIADRVNNRVRKVNVSGIITNIAGNGASGFSGDNGPATSAMLNTPCAVAVDKYGNVFISDALNNRIRKVDTFGTITTIAGTGTPGYNGDGISSITAQISSPLGIIVDTSGNIYFSDYGNYRIRKINNSGVITTIAGTGTAGFGGDGGSATSAMINQVIGLTMDKSGNIYFSDSQNNRIRLVNTMGNISTIAGNGGNGYNGDGGLAISANINYPAQITVDSWGNLYIAGGSGYTVRKVASGIITRVAGTGTSGYSGDNGPALNAQFNGPIGIAVDTAGYVYVSDAGNNRVRKIDNSVRVEQFLNNKIQMLVYPNPSNNKITLQSDTELGSITIYNTLGEVVLQTKSRNTREQIDMSALSTGVYTLQTDGRHLKLIKE